MRFIGSVLFVAGVLAWPGTFTGQSSDPWFGTWKLNVAKSKFRPGPGPKSILTRIEPWDGGLKYTVDRVTQDGAEQHVEWSAKFDGKDNPVTGNPGVDTDAIKRINARAYQVIAKKDGHVVATIRNVVSRDGETRTVTAIEKNDQLTGGRRIRDVAVFERQD
jgi:hypothetical protein